MRPTRVVIPFVAFTALLIPSYASVELPGQYQDTDYVLHRGLGIVREALNDPWTLQRHDPSIIIDERFLHPEFGVAADYATWRRYRAEYEASVDSQFNFQRLTLKRRTAEDPLAAPLVLDQWVRLVELAKTPSELMAAALAAADIAIPATLAANSGPDERQTADVGRFHSPALVVLDSVARIAHQILDREALGALGDEERDLLPFLVQFTTTTGGTYSSGSLDAPAYNWHLVDAYLDDGTVKYRRYFEPGSLQTPQGLDVPSGLSTATSVYHFFRSLTGDSHTISGLTETDEEWSGEIADFGDLRVDLAAVARAFGSVAPLLEPAFLERLERELLGRLRLSQAETIPGVDGEVLLHRETPYGGLLVGGPGPNRYYDVQASIIIDVGGNDTYEVDYDLERLGRYPLRLLIDLDGDDVYSHRTPVGPGAGVFGLGILLDQAGNDIYAQGVDPMRGREREKLLFHDSISGMEWVDPARVYGDAGPGSLDGGFSYGAAYFGIGLHIDVAGDDTYLVDKWALGAAYGPGVGILSDKAGDDWYVAALQSIGIGFNKGVGVLRDEGAGKDLYQSWGVYQSHYGPGIGFDGFGIGVGSAWRSEVHNNTDWDCYVGGLGLVDDGGGDDRYIGSTFGLGNGFSAGIGMLVDNAGDDVYLAMKGEEEEHSGLGEGIHHGIGMLLDRAGNDIFSGGATSGSGWDLGVGFLIDVSGDDTYTDYHRLGFKPAHAQVQSLAVFLDGGGEDTVTEWSNDWANASLFYPQVHDGMGGNFSFALLLGAEPNLLPPQLSAVLQGPVTFTPVFWAAEEEEEEEYPKGIGVMLVESGGGGISHR